MQSMSDALRDDVRTLLDNLSREELLAARRYLERVLEERGVDPYAWLDEADELDDEERARLHAAIERGLAEMRAGKGRPAAEVLAELRRRQ
jgi:hypothetical protein